MRGFSSVSQVCGGDRGRKGVRRALARIGDAACRGLVAGLVLVAGMPQGSAATLLTWDVNGTTGSTGSGIASAPLVGISGSAMTSGAGLAAGNSSGGVTSPANTWNRTYSTLYTSATAAMAGNQFIQWTTTAAPGYTVSINGLTGMNLARTSSGPPSAELWYSTDGATFLQTGTSFTVTSTLTSAASAFASTMSATPIVLDGGVSGSTLTWRLVGYGSTSRMGIGNAGTDDFSILGTISGGAAKNLTWVGSGGGNGAWDTDPANKPWTTGSSSSAFSTNDNVTFATAGTVTVGSGVSAGTVTVANGSGTMTIGGNGFAGTTLSKSGVGELLLTASNTLSGGVSATAGTISYGAVGALGVNGVALDGATLKMADPAVTTFANAYSSGTAGATLAIAAGVTGTMTGVGSAAGTQAGVGILRGDSRTFSTLVKTGSGAVQLRGNLGAQMSYTTGTSGGVTTSGGINLQVQQGTIEIANGKTWNLASGTNVTTGSTTYNGMQWDGNVNMRGGTIQINGGNIQGSGTISVGLPGDVVTANTLQSRLNFNSAEIANTVSIADGFTLTLASPVGASIRLTGTVLGGSSSVITNSGNGTATLTGTTPSTFAGTFVVTGSQGGMSLSPQAMAGATKVTNNNSLSITNAVAGAVTSTPIEGTGSVTVNGSQKVTVSGANTYAGGTILTGDVGMTKLWDGTSGSLGSGVITAGGADGRIYWDGPATTVTFDQAVNTGAAATSRLGFAGTGKTFVLTAPVSGSGQLRASSGAILDLTQQTAATNSNTGGIEIGNATVYANGDDNLGAGAVNFSGTSSIFVARAASTSISRPITVGVVSGTGIYAQFDTGSNSLTLTGSISDTAATTGGGIVKLGPGRLTLTATSSYTGPTLINGGTLAMASTASIVSSSTVAVASGATLNLGGGNQSVRSLAGSGSITTGGATLTVGVGDASGTFAGVISGSGRLTKVGAGTLSLAGANTLTGSTTVGQGTLQVASAAALASSRITPLAGGTVTLAPYLQTAVAGLNPNAGGLVDVGNGLVVVAGGLTVPNMLTAITAGYNGGTWTGTTGITSSTAAVDTAAGNPRAIGWLDNGDGSVTFAFAAPGDTNLDGLIDVLDAAALSSAGRFNDTAVWSEGDFNYDGIYDDLDNALFVSTGLFDAGPYNAPPGSAGAIAPVPEPSTWLVLGMGLVGGACLRRRRQG